MDAETKEGYGSVGTTEGEDGAASKAHYGMGSLPLTHTLGTPPLLCPFPHIYLTTFSLSLTTGPNPRRETWGPERESQSHSAAQKGLGLKAHMVTLGLAKKPSLAVSEPTLLVLLEGVKLTDL